MVDREIIPFYCDHRAVAAFFAIALRFRVESAAARALPPFMPPLCPRATAFGSLPASGSGSCTSRTVSPTIIFAS